MISAEERAKLMAENPPSIELIGTHAYFNWSWKGCGFGQLSFHMDEQGVVRCLNECMSRERVRTLLVAMANHIADTCVLEE